MNTERDKSLTEAMGECWHESNLQGVCKHCKAHNYPYTNNFSTWEGFGKLWVWASSQVGLLRMITNELDKNDSYRWTHWVHPDRFADAVYAYLKAGGVE